MLCRQISAESRMDFREPPTPFQRDEYYRSNAKRCAGQDESRQAVESFVSAFDLIMMAAAAVALAAAVAGALIRQRRANA